MNLDALERSPRLLVEADLRPVQGTRFQPTGFPDLGAAEYAMPDGSGKMLLLESAQSMANRLEAVCWDEAGFDLQPELRGLPYVVAEIPGGAKTSSILEAHRLNSPYIVNADGFEEIEEAVGFEDNAPFNRRRLAQALLSFDPMSLIHGCFLEKIAGVVRLPRLLSGFMEATDVNVAASGGVKVDRVQPASGSDKTQFGKAAEGYGNVPYHRDEYVARQITAYFNLDLALLRGLGLSAEARALLIGVSLYKIRAFLDTGLRLRTACDLDLIEEPRVMRPDGFELPTLDALTAALPKLVSAAAEHFHTPPVFTVRYTGKRKKKSGGKKSA